MADYAHPETLVDTTWVREHLEKPGIRLIEIDVDTAGYDSGRVPGAIGFNWTTELQDQVRRDILDKAGFERLMSHAGIRPEDTVVLYGDHHNWFAAYGFWLFKIYGHADVRLMDGGRQKWIDEGGTLITDIATFAHSEYVVTSVDDDLRVLLPEVLEVARNGGRNLIDVRSPDEFTGKVIAPPGMTESAQRGGHIPGATSVPWVTAVAADGTFKSADELRAVYIDDAGVDVGRDTIAYCRIGERSSHTWFVLRYLLGLKNVKNYDGSWTEYGSIIGAPIETGAPVLA